MYTLKIVNGDWDFTHCASGVSINNEDCLWQWHMCNIKTVTGANNFCPDFGSDVELLVGSTPENQQNLIVTAIRTATAKENQRILQNYHENQTSYLPSQVPINLNFCWATGENTYDIGIQTLAGGTQQTWQY